MSVTPGTVRLADYTPPTYLIDRVELRFELGEDATEVLARLHLRRNPDVPAGQPLTLDGEDLELLGLALDGEPLAASDYTLHPEGLDIPSVPARFMLDVTTRLHPRKNTRLEGLYRSGDMFCTQCEAEGFRRITYFPDRPDVMARYAVTIAADRGRYPVLLSNGNPVASGEDPGDRHWVRWEDPFPKPSYLFALVAGDLHCHEDRHVTRSGREIRLAIYTEHENAGKTDHAMDSLKAAMAWDETVYALECDLDNYMIVAVGDFNMGAMENKGLNIFNTQYVLARPETATDTDYTNIEAVIGHEYFHNWTGNRVTLRDWFQLSLKEGLTVFRERQFSAARGAPTVKRIQDVRALRAAQYPEDAGPMAHPVRPEAYVEINNFYTATVYMKGAEVIRMYHTLLGQEGFRRGMDRYFERHDGQAVTCEDFLAAMADANGVDLGQFSRWYRQAGTPAVRASDHYDAEQRRYTLTLCQQTDPTPGQAEKAPLHIPVATALLGAEGATLPLRLEGEQTAGGHSRVLELREQEQRFTFADVPSRPVPSLLRGFSAPVRLEYDYDDDQLAFLLVNDSDDFNRWEAGQRLASRVLLRSVESGPAPMPDILRDAFLRTLTDERADPALVAEALSLPAETYLAEQMKIIDVDGIHRAREALRADIARLLGRQLQARYDALAPAGAYRHDADSAARRRLRNVVLDYLTAGDDPDAVARCLRQYRQADNMTDAIAALALLADTRHGEADAVLEEFYRRWRDDPLVVDKWFRVQAASGRPDTLERVRRLARHPAFDRSNPNRIRALVGTFCHGNAVRFHDISGAGYTFLTDHVIELDGINPQIAARLATPLSRWGRYDSARADLMRRQLERIFDVDGLSKDLYEVVAKSIGSVDPLA